MANMSPDMYRGILRNAEELVNRIDCYLDGKTLDGLSLPIMFIGDIEAMVSNCEKAETELSFCLAGLGANSKRRPIYANLLSKTIECKTKLKHQQEILRGR